MLDSLRAKASAVAAAHSRPPLRPPPGHSSTAGTRRSATRRTSWPTGCCATGRASTSAGTGRAVERRPAKPPLARAAPRVAATAAAEAASRWGASDNTDYGMDEIGCALAQHSVWAALIHMPMLRACKYGDRSDVRHRSRVQQLTAASSGTSATRRPCTAAVVDVAGRRGRRRDGHWRGRRRGRQRRGRRRRIGKPRRMRPAAEASVLDVGGLVRAALGTRVGEAQAHVTSL